jgi:hypothetical protein
MNCIKVINRKLVFLLIKLNPCQLFFREKYELKVKARQFTLHDNDRYRRHNVRKNHALILIVMAKSKSIIDKITTNDIISKILYVIVMTISFLLCSVRWVCETIYCHLHFYFP